MNDILISQDEFDKRKSRDSIPFKCHRCHRISNRNKNLIQINIKEKTNLYCSHSCSSLYSRKRIQTTCKNCGISYELCPSTARKVKNTFCSRHCAGKYNSSHRTTGTRRSKLEQWLESKLTILYPDLNIKYNDKSAIQAELDIYIPSLKLAFELNGPFHYEPIFGKEKLDTTQNNDKRKFQACLERNIELCIIDTSKQKYFKEKHCQPFLDIINKIILEARTRFSQVSAGLQSAA